MLQPEPFPVVLGLGRNIFCFCKFFFVAVFGCSRMQQGEIMPKCACAQCEQQLPKPDGRFLVTLHTLPLRGSLGCRVWVHGASSVSRGGVGEAASTEMLAHLLQGCSHCRLLFTSPCRTAQPVPALSQGASSALGPNPALSWVPAQLLLAPTLLSGQGDAAGKTPEVQAVAWLRVGVCT